MKKTATRCGFDFRVLKYTDNSPVLNVDFINKMDIELTSDRVSVTGGKDGGEIGGFDKPYKGTMKLSTQIVPIELIALAASKNGVVTGGTYSVREVITVATDGELTLSNAPVAGTLYVYAEDSDLTGESAATTATSKAVTIEGAKAGDKYVAYYMYTNATAKKVSFNDSYSTGYYVIDGETTFTDMESNTDHATHIHAYKAKPKKAFTLNLDGTGDVASFDMEFDLYKDSDGNILDDIEE